MLFAVISFFMEADSKLLRIYYDIEEIFLIT